MVNNSCRSLYIDSKGRLWIGTINGVSVFDKGVFRNYSASQGIRPGEVFGFCEDGNHNIWIGSGGGLFRIKEGKVKEVLLEILKYLSRQYNKETIRSLEPLFTNETEYKEFKKRHKKLTIFHLDESKFSDVKKMAICGKSA